MLQEFDSGFCLFQTFYKFHSFPLAPGTANSTRSKISGIPSTLFRCSLHRARTCELNGLELMAEVESFLVNLPLLLRRKTNFLQTLQQQVLGWALEHVQIFPGTPPADVVAYRQRLAHALFRQDETYMSDAALRRKVFFETLANMGIFGTVTSSSIIVPERAVVLGAFFLCEKSCVQHLASTVCCFRRQPCFQGGAGKNKKRLQLIYCI